MDTTRRYGVRPMPMAGANPFHPSVTETLTLAKPNRKKPRSAWAEVRFRGCGRDSGRCTDALGCGPGSVDWALVRACGSCWPGSRFDYEREAGDLWSKQPGCDSALKWGGRQTSRGRRMIVAKVLRDGTRVDLPVAPDALFADPGVPTPHYSCADASARPLLLSLVCDGNGLLDQDQERLEAAGAALLGCRTGLMQPVWPEGRKACTSGPTSFLRDYELCDGVPSSERDPLQGRPSTPKERPARPSRP